MDNMNIEDKRNADDASDIEYEQIDETLYVQILTSILLDLWSSLKGM
jgi:hypothetical protein